MIILICLVHFVLIESQYFAFVTSKLFGNLWFARARKTAENVTEFEFRKGTVLNHIY